MNRSWGANEVESLVARYRNVESEQANREIQQASGRLAAFPVTVAFSSTPQASTVMI